MFRVFRSLSSTLKQSLLRTSCSVKPNNYEASIKALLEPTISSYPGLTIYTLNKIKRRELHDILYTNAVNYDATKTPYYDNNVIKVEKIYNTNIYVNLYDIYKVNLYHYYQYNGAERTLRVMDDVYKLMEYRCLTTGFDYAEFLMSLYNNSPCRSDTKIKMSYHDAELYIHHSDNNYIDYIDNIVINMTFANIVDYKSYIFHNGEKAFREAFNKTSFTAHNKKIYNTLEKCDSNV